MRKNIAYCDMQTIYQNLCTILCQETSDNTQKEWFEPNMSGFEFQLWKIHLIAKKK